MRGATMEGPYWAMYPAVNQQLVIAVEHVQHCVRASVFQVLQPDHDLWNHNEKSLNRHS